MEQQERIFIPIKDAAAVAGYDEWENVDIEACGYLHDYDSMKWYFFRSKGGKPCYTYKRVG